MIDFRHETFYRLCQLKSYTKTAEYLHLTQPAVSQHIRYLEKLYGGALFEYNGRKLSLTQRGERLYRYVQVLRADTKKIGEELQKVHTEHPSVFFGATLTIGEYVMPEVLHQILREHPHYHIGMVVENTQKLLQELSDGTIDFALLEGYFDQSRYGAKLLSYEKFIPVCSPASPFAGKTVSFDAITSRRLILREKGSGTREILEQALKAHNYSLDSFEQVCEIGNMNAIKELVGRDDGISFMYLQAAARELEEGKLAEFQIEGFSAGHEFNFVFLANSVYEEQYLGWFDMISQAYQMYRPRLHKADS
jgi:DNA-binding transcriptional LysR family regulator